MFGSLYLPLCSYAILIGAWYLSTVTIALGFPTDCPPRCMPNVSAHSIIFFDVYADPRLKTG